MKSLTISNALLILALPALLLLLVLNFVAFDESFYRQKFLEYNVDKNLSESLHPKVMDFIAGKSGKLPDDFNEREKGHLEDVRNVVRISRILLYSLIILLVLFLAVSFLNLKQKNLIINFIGKILVFGGFLTIVIAAALFLLINYDFSSAFESFHRMFFQPGTYMFDPANEKLVQIYPEQLFMDLGIKISKWAVFASVIVVALGLVLLFRSKRK